MPRHKKGRKSGTRASPLVGSGQAYKTTPTGAPQTEPKIGENVLDYDMDEGEAHNPMNRVNNLISQHTHQSLAEAQMEGGCSFSCSPYSHIASNSSKTTASAPEPLNCAPPQTIRVAIFPKNGSAPRLVWKQTVDVKAEKRTEDVKLSHIPDFREDWGDKWHSYRKAYYVHVAPIDIPEVKLHGWYVVFATWEPGYAKNTHKMIEGIGRHVHEDIFVARIRLYPDCNKWTAYVDMPDEFLSATTIAGQYLYQIYLAETNNSMIGAILG